MLETDTAINVCLATDKNYLRHAGAVIASILKHAGSDDVLTFYILQDNLDEQDREKLLNLKTINPCEFKFIDPDLNNLPRGKFLKYISKASLLRLQLPDLLPHITRIIYLDCDVIVMTSLKKLWQTQMGDAIGAGTADYNSGLLVHNRDIGCADVVYLNSGVLLFNLDLARKENICEKFLKTAEDLGTRATLLDQDIINVTLKNRLNILPLKWNLSTGYFKRKYELQYYSDMEIMEAVTRPGILHFSGAKKPWSWQRCRHAFWFDYFQSLKKTPWRNAYWWGIVKKIIYPYKKSTGPAAIAYELRRRKTLPYGVKY